MDIPATHQDMSNRLTYRGNVYWISSRLIKLLTPFNYGVTRYKKK